MKTCTPNYFNLESFVYNILKESGYDALPIDPKEIATKRGIAVMAKPIDGGVSGMLIRYGNEFTIAYGAHLNNEGFENFSVAHELGHYFLPGHSDAVLDGQERIHVSRAGSFNTDKYEDEADRFAAALLMPAHLFGSALKTAGEGLAAIESLALKCKTSLHAAAIRYSELTPEPMAIIISEGKKIDHCFMSKALKEIQDIDWIKKGDDVPFETATFGINEIPDNVANRCRREDTSYFQLWFGGKRNFELCEDVIRLGSYGKTLTVLYGLDLPDPEEEEEEELIERSWVPHFKR